MNTTIAPDMQREELHLRRIELRGFRRGDGLFEVEGRIVDTKPFDFAPPSGARMARAGEPIHDLGVRLVFDADMVVREVHTASDAYPYRDCAQGGLQLQALVGLRIGAGWNSEVRRRLPPAETCTHLRELLIPMATAAMQALGPLRIDQLNATDAQDRPLKLDSCYAYGASREIVLRRWPAFHRPASEGASSALLG
ncbi:DUF2889 domain-containing protein [Pseudorhodoferax sp.]|uniref:DUF2889 domain-containing protein n=1 Tax=Pseudorhodoferax sp. TaxID=1993553 RepID=UPI0039E309B9